MAIATMLLVPWMTCPQAPITTMVQGFTSGDQFALEVTPDGHRAFVAEGASIALLNLENLLPDQEPTVITRVQVPDCSPRALLYYEVPASPTAMPTLFIAGGSMGLWRIEWCPGLPTTPCLPGGYFTHGPTLIEPPIETNFERKRCVDVAVVPGNASTGGDPILFALYAATSDTSLTQVDPTEVRAYSLKSDGTTPRFPSPEIAVKFAPTTAPTLPHAGTALATDPGDPDSVYVAMGRGGIWRLDIDASTTPTSLVSTQILAEADNVRDLSITQVNPASGVKSILYAALNYGRIAEMDLSVVTPIPTYSTTGSKYLERIAATSPGDSTVLVAVAFEAEPSVLTESRAPIRTTGFWRNVCVNPGLNDKYEPTNSFTQLDAIAFFGRGIDDPSTPTLNPIAPCEPTPPDLLDQDPFWGSLILRTTPADDFICYACSATGQTKILRLTFPCPTDPTASVIQVERRYTQNPQFGAWDGTVSSVDSNVLRFGFETGPGVPVGTMMTIDRVSNQVVLSPVPDANSACVGTWVPTSCPLAEPNPFASNFFGEAHWLDPNLPGLEWFMPGGPWYLPTTPSGPDCVYVQGDCDLQACHTTWSKASDSNLSKIAYKLVRLDLNVQPPTGTSLALNWWQLTVPNDIDHSLETPGGDYVRSVQDPRLDKNNVPLLVHGVRSFTAAGLLLYRTLGLMDTAVASCPGLGGGKGQRLPDGEIGQQVQQLWTHFELETGVDGNPCTTYLPPETCSTPEQVVGPHQLSNSRSDVFSVIDAQGNEKWVAAVAAGYSAAGPGTPANEEANCPWRRYHTQSMVVFYDVTETGDSFQEARLLTIGVKSLPSETDPIEYSEGSNAWAVTTKTYGTGPAARTFVFVGDIVGRLIIYEVSFDSLFPSATSPFLREHDPATQAPRPNRFLLPIANGVRPFPVDPYDGHRCNCVDVEVIGDYLYCALGRGGVGIVDIGSPTNPNFGNLIAVLDTPGLALGLTPRVEPGAPTGMQLIVGDSRCGLRVYE